MIVKSNYIYSLSNKLKPLNLIRELTILTRYFHQIEDISLGLIMNNLFRTFLILLSLAFISSCGGGGGGGGSNDAGAGGGGYGTSNSAPVITNASLNISVQENQTSAFTVSATDSNGDLLSYSISGSDSSLVSISNQGVVTFNAAPDYEIPTNSNNVYTFNVSVSDESLSDSKTFQVTVTNDTSDDITTSGYDGVVINGSYVQSAKVCIEETVGEGCSSASVTTDTAVNGSFSFEVDSTITGALIAEGGFNPNTNYTFADELKTLRFAGDASTDQNMVVSELTNMMTAYSDFTFETLKTSLDINQDFMIRFDDPYSNLNDADNTKVALINNQLLILKKALTRLDPAEADDASTDSVEYKLAKAIATKDFKRKISC